MGYIISEEEYYQLWKKTVDLINAEFDYYNSDGSGETKACAYPKLIIMEAFLELLRGEAFTEVRPHMPEHQKEFCKAERDLLDKIDEFKKDMDWTENGRADCDLKEWRNLFENPEKK